MSFLKRIGSVRKKGSYRLSVGEIDRPHSQALSETSATKGHSGVIHCHVTMLDDSVFSLEMNKHSLGNTLLEEVYRHADVLEKDYFGVAYSDGGFMKWIDPEKSLKKQLKTMLGSAVLEFRVKFYASDPINLHEELTRYLFFRQVKKDILVNRLPCSQEAAAVLSAFALQSEIGDYDPVSHANGYVSEFRFVRNQNESFELRVADIHRSIRGQSNTEAEYNFLRYACQQEFYGIELYPARDDSGTGISLGVGALGITVFQDTRKLNTFSWPHVLKITYSRKKFYIELRPDPNNSPILSNVIGFHMDNHDASKQLWRTCIEHHAFFRMTEINKSVKRGNPLRQSRVKITRRTERQAVEANKSMARDSVQIKRTPSKRYPRRVLANDENLSSGTNNFRRRANTEIQRTGSLRERSVTSINSYKRTNSPDVTPTRRLSRETTPAMSSPRSPSLPDELEISEWAGQFELDQTEQSGYTTLQYGSHLNGVGDKSDITPNEYYYELNAAEELCGQMTIDDLASENLLLIRVNPDEMGRFGFHVKGGVDINLPVIVTKIKDDSPARDCHPPLEEGDQVLFINGMPTDTATHADVIAAIKDSLSRQPPQLVLIVKPKDLTRIDPTIQNLNHKKPSSDPASLLRESVTQLKESVITGSVLLNFDRLYHKKPGLFAIASKLPQNLSKNRFRDITAYDITRVHLLDGPVDYINANYVNMDIVSTGQVIRYIATQGPMQNTCTDFWQMVWEQDCSFIVMLTDIIEDGKVQCCRYWPDQGNTTDYGSFEIYCESDRYDNYYSTKHFNITNHKTEEQRQVVHLQYSDWPDQNIPRTKSDFLRFVRRLHSLRERMEDPIVVHCSGGIDRTGLLIAMEAALTKIQVVESLNPLEIVRMMRDQRGMLLPSLNQYKFFCECIVQAYEEDYLEIELPSGTASKTS